jgi:putative SOS response-associated peptidase YedK
MCGRFTLTWNEWRQVAGALGTAIHDRMPMIPNERAAEDWMNPSRARCALVETVARAGASGSARNAVRLAAGE